MLKLGLSSGSVLTVPRDTEVCVRLLSKDEREQGQGPGILCLSLKTALRLDSGLLRRSTAMPLSILAHVWSLERLLFKSYKT